MIERRGVVTGEQRRWCRGNDACCLRIRWLRFSLYLSFAPGEHGKVPETTFPNRPCRLERGWVFTCVWVTLCEPGFSRKKRLSWSMTKMRVWRSTCSSGNCSFQLKWILQAVLRPGQVSDGGRPTALCSPLPCTGLLLCSSALRRAVWNHVGVFWLHNSVFLKGCCLRRCECERWEGEPPAPPFSQKTLRHISIYFSQGGSIQRVNIVLSTKIGVFLLSNSPKVVKQTMRNNLKMK